MKAPRLSDLIRQLAPAEDLAASPPPAPLPAVGREEIAADRGKRIVLEAPAFEPPREERVAFPHTPTEIEARRDYDLLEQWLGGLYEQARRGNFDPGDVFEDVRAILRRPRLLDALFTETFRSREGDSSFARNSLNVAVYSLRLGKVLGYGEADLVELGVAGLLHKIGLARLPENLLSKRARFERGELAQIREHPKIGYELLRRVGGQFARVAKIVHEASERSDGSGYPRALREGEIVEAALVVGLVGVFDALIQPRPYRERMIPFAAVKELLERERERFPRRLLREFVAAFSVFPPFSYVRLSSRAIARVLETEPGQPLRPIVSVVLDADGRPPSEPQMLRLFENPRIYIVGPASEGDLPMPQRREVGKSAGSSGEE